MKESDVFKIKDDDDDVPIKSLKDPSRLCKHGICIQHYQDSNSQPVQFQVHTDSSRPQ